MNKNNLSEIVLFESSDGAISLDVQTDRETVWLSLNQISSLFDRDKSTISRHIKNVYEDRELNESSTVALIATVQNEGDRTVEREVQYYNLDVIISVGYRVKSQRGVEFRRWATDVLRRYIIDGHDESDLFGVEKDDSFKSSIATIYQSFGGQNLYPSVQEKAANLLYFIVKNHSFHDGNKRIAATVFLYFLEKNGLLYKDGQKIVSDSALVATTIMIAESKPEEKEIMVSLVMNFLV